MVASQPGATENAGSDTVVVVVETLRDTFGAGALSIAEAQQHVATGEMSTLWSEVASRLRI